MAGHSKWNNIKNRKGAVDAKRGKVFSQLSKLIRSAVKEGKSGDPKFNPSLRLILEKAKAVNMPKENIQRAIDRGLGKGKAGLIQEIVYEGYASGGVGLVIVAHSDNAQRTAAEVRNILSKAGGSLGGPGSAMFMFERRGEEYKPTMPMELTDEEHIVKLEELMDTLRNNEDVEDVYSIAVWEGQEEGEEAQ
jgi:YebC/PmpR family DNA-binding regulatory protein